MEKKEKMLNIAEEKKEIFSKSRKGSGRVNGGSREDAIDNSRTGGMGGNNYVAFDAFAEKRVGKRKK